MDTDNNKVTLAVLENTLEMLTQEIAELRADIKGNFAVIRADMQASDGRIRIVETQCVKHEERLGLVAGGLAVLQLIVGGIAAGIGMIFK